VLWLKAPGTGAVDLDALVEKPRSCYNSDADDPSAVLKRKGYIAHSKDGRAHVYVPLVGRKEAREPRLATWVAGLQDSHEQLVLNILEERGIDAGELDRLREMLIGAGTK